MADIQISKAHQLTQQQAHSKVDQLAHKLESELNLTTKWLDDSRLSFERSGASGAITVTEQEVNVEVKLGFLLKAMRGTIEQELEKALNEAFC